MGRRKEPIPTYEETELRRMWRERPADKRTMFDLQLFHADLLSAHSSLLGAGLMRGKGDSWQRIKMLLQDETTPIS
jgi:hypothetical protein